MVFIPCIIKVHSVDVIFNQGLDQNTKTDTCLVWAIRGNHSKLKNQILNFLSSFLVPELNIKTCPALTLIVMTFIEEAYIKVSQGIEGLLLK